MQSIQTLALERLFFWVSFTARNGFVQLFPCEFIKIPHVLIVAICIDHKIVRNREQPRFWVVHRPFIAKVPEQAKKRFLNDVLGAARISRLPQQKPKHGKTKLLKEGLYPFAEGHRGPCSIFMQLKLGPAKGPD